MARVLGVIRLSHLTDESTSPERQRRAIQGWADSKGHEVVAWAEDLDVSGSVAPWERAELGQYLPHPDRPAQGDVDTDWDVLCSWKLDRLSRRVLHVHQVHSWCKENGKTIASAEDGFDLTTPIGELVFTMLASFAEMELETMKFRARQSARDLIAAGRWRGGILPYGYKPEPAPDGGYILVPDGSADIVRSVMKRVIDGETLNAITRWLNENEIPTPQDRQRQIVNKPIQGKRWSVGNVSRVFKSIQTLGWSESKGKIVRGEDGLPLQRAEPLVDRELYDRFIGTLHSRRRSESSHRRDRSMLLQVAYCVCGLPLYRNYNGRFLYYRCGSKSLKSVGCTQSGKGIRADALEAIVERVVLSEIGNEPVVQRVYEAGEDHSTEIADTTRALDDLQADRQAGLYASGKALERFRTQYLALSERLEELEAMPSRPSGWRNVATGVLYRDHWAGLEGSAERNTALRNAGVRVTLHPERLPALSVADIVTDDGFRHREGRCEILIPLNMAENVRDTQ